MIRLADIAVYAQDGTLQLVVEVKNKAGASAEWVAQMRRDLLAYSVIPKSPYFLLALPDFFHLWKNAWQDDRFVPADAPPDYTIEAAEALAAYLDGPALSLNTISEDGLELLVISWLDDLVRYARPHGEGNTSAWLFDSGLYQAIRNGSVVTEAIV